MPAEIESSHYGFGTTLSVSIEEAIARTINALKAEGFGVLTTIDVQQTMREKLGVDFEPYVILGACKPQLAHRALQAEHDLGLLLPCNVIVHEHDGTSVVSILDPAQMLGVVGDNPALRPVATEAGERLRRVVTALGESNGRGREGTNRYLRGPVTSRRPRSSACIRRPSVNPFASMRTHRPYASSQRRAASGRSA
jgi:uncharacterized protein (DUF302 family)